MLGRPDAQAADDVVIQIADRERRHDYPCAVKRCNDSIEDCSFRMKISVSISPFRSRALVCLGAISDHGSMDDKRRGGIQHATRR
jgi:hypothetical protein